MTEPSPDQGAPDPAVDEIRAGYAFTGPALELGGLMTGPTTLTDVHVRIPLGPAR